MPLEKYFIAVLCLLATAPVLGAPGGDSNGLEPRVTALENRVDTLEAGGGGGGGSAWVVVDSDGYDVGTVVSIGNTLEAVVKIDEPGYDPYLVTITREGTPDFGEPLYFTTTDCSADALGGGVFTSVYLNSLTDVAIFVEPGFPDSRVAYLVDDTPTLADIKSISEYGGCDPYPWSFLAFPVTPVSGTDLHDAYPPPYRLESQ